MDRKDVPDERNLAKLIEGERRKMTADWGFIARSTKHGESRGSHNETTLRKVLRTQLPMKYGIGSGFVEAASGKQSSQQDIIIYDALNHSPLYEGDDWGIYPVEIVLATIEVKTTLDKDAVDETLEAIAGLRQLAKIHQKIETVVASEEKRLIAWKAVEHRNCVAPRNFIFAYESVQRKPDTLIEHLVEASKKHDGSHIHGLCILKDDWFFRRVPADGETYKFDFLPDAGWRTFLRAIQLNIASLSTDGMVNRDAYLETVAQKLPQEA